MPLSSPMIRGFVFGLSFLLTISVGIGGMAYAANSGGRFGEILNLILASGNWQTDTTGLVKNAQSLSGLTADKYTPVSAIPSCGGSTCLKMGADNVLKCQ